MGNKLVIMKKKVDLFINYKFIKDRIINNKYYI